MTEASEVLEQATSLLAEVGRAPMSELSDESLCLLLADAEQAGRLLDAVRVRAAAEVEDRSRYELGSDGLSKRLGETRGTHLIERITLISSAEANRRVRLGTVIRERRTLDGQPLDPVFPAVARAMNSGELGMDAAAHITRCLTQAAEHGAAPDGIDTAEQRLVELGATKSADHVAIEARVWREALDPDGTEPRDEKLRKKRAFWLGQEVNGMTPFGGVADPINAGLLRAAFATNAGPKVTPRFLNEKDEAAGTEQIPGEDGETTAAVSDPRSREQRQFDIVIGLLMAGLRSAEGKHGMRGLTSVMAVIQLSDLENGTGRGWIDDVQEPVSGATVRELACDSGFQPIVLGVNGEVLHLGRLERYFTPAQRKALAVRDGTCVWNGCHAPPDWCHAHHVIPWDARGPTDIDNGVLLCSEHHHEIHKGDYKLRMIDGTPWMLAPRWVDPKQLWQRVGRTRATMVA